MPNSCSSVHWRYVKRLTKAGVKSYVFTKKVNGKFLRITLGKTAGMSLSAARAAASAHHGDIAKGVDVGALRKDAKTISCISGMPFAGCWLAVRLASNHRKRPRKVTRCRRSTFEFLLRR